ncbi:hypothetical protein [Paenibacillus pedocola]|uniref:hypothetical protein n=1 Tax=Paenibacillus pedocola TaxID=3242193 RepID=UPI0028778641|nr:hypothetical protein [Paenibacillus typhae]
MPSERFANSILAKLLRRTSNNGEILVSAEAAWLNQTGNLAGNHYAVRDRTAAALKSAPFTRCEFMVY